MKKFLILIFTVSVSLFLWTQVNKPFHLVESSYPVNSLSLNPYKKSQSPFDHAYLSMEDLDSDLKVLADKTKTVRLYSSTGGAEQIPELAKPYNLSVIVSAFLQGDKTIPENSNEFESAIKLAGHYKNVSRVILGNETQLHRTVPREDLIDYLRDARKRLRTPVSTAEPWDFWINNPEMVDEVDYIAIHILPYWNEIPIDQAVNYVIEKYQAVKNLYPKKKIFIAETGWPSDGPERGPATPSLANQARFIRDFLTRASEQKIDYNIIEAFDQPWKSAMEGRVGEHWGLLDADRHVKFPLEGPVLEDPKWKYWALSSTLIGFLASILYILRRRNLRSGGMFLCVVIFQLLAALATQMARQASDQYMSPNEILFWTIMISAQVLLAIILITDALEIADVVGHKPLTRRFDPQKNLPANTPFVSIHVACCREPPDMVIATIDSLAALHYPNFEVLVIDNNTMDSALWEPVKKRCEELGEKFRFFTLGKYPGFKAGALNFGLKNTDPRAEVVGVVDADYVVSPDWLQAAIPYFINDAEVALVQAPQEHRDWEGNLFQRMENDEYSGFFRIGMVQRNEDNAIIQHGTMTLIRRPVLDQLHGWAEWCICEDSELGLRILNERKKSVYLDHPFGHGLVPDSYEAYAKQRFRWAYGAMRIMRGHWQKMFGLTGYLTKSQRYQFIKGWLPWIGDALHMVFTFTALIWSGVLLMNPVYTDFPDPIFVFPALGLVVLRLMGTLWTYATRVRIGKRRTVLAMIAGGSLTHKIAKAVFQGLLSNSLPFYRTPKMDKAPPIFKSLLHVWEEFVLALALWLSSFGTYLIFGTENRTAVIWMIALIVQSFPYIAAILASLVSGFSAWRGQRD